MRLLLLFNMCLLIIFYSCCLYLAINPKVSDAYRLYYIDKISKSFHENAYRYSLGENVVTASFGNGLIYLAKGWSDSEQPCTWTDSSDAYLLFSTNNLPARNLELYAKIQGFVTHKHPQQTVDIYVNNQFIDQWEFLTSDAVEKYVFIPQKLLASTQFLVITMIIKDRISPYKLGLSEDKRKLGVCLHWLKIDSSSNDQ